MATMTTMTTMTIGAAALAGSHPKHGRATIRDRKPMSDKALRKDIPAAMKPGEYPFECRREKRRSKDPIVEGAGEPPETVWPAPP